MCKKFWPYLFSHESCISSSEQRIQDIKFWRQELDQKFEEMVQEIETLIIYKSRVERALESCFEPFQVTLQCLTERYSTSHCRAQYSYKEFYLTYTTKWIKSDSKDFYISNKCHSFELLNNVCAADRSGWRLTLCMMRWKRSCWRRRRWLKEWWLCFSEHWSRSMSRSGRWDSDKTRLGIQRLTYAGQIIKSETPSCFMWKHE